MSRALNNAPLASLFLKSLQKMEKKGFGLFLELFYRFLLLSTRVKGQLKFSTATVHEVR